MIEETDAIIIIERPSQEGTAESIIALECHVGWTIYYSILKCFPKMIYKYLNDIQIYYATLFQSSTYNVLIVIGSKQHPLSSLVLVVMYSIPLQY